VRSLTQAHHYRDRRASPSPSPSHLSLFRDDPSPETDVQTQAAQTRNDSPSSALPVPPLESSDRARYEGYSNDVESGWSDEGLDDEGRGRARDSSSERAEGSARDLRTTIWRRFEALRGAGMGLQRGADRAAVDRDR
jgi:hypothetical protein